MTLKLHSTATIININEPLEHYKYIINTGILYCIVYSGNLSSTSTAVFFHCCPKFLCRTPVLLQVSAPCCPWSHPRSLFPAAPGVSPKVLALSCFFRSLLATALGLASGPCYILQLQQQFDGIKLQ